MAKSTTYCVYRIVCFPTAKIYIGQTLDVKARRAKHFRDLDKGCHGNTHLQYAYNKWGRTSFFFEILERDISADEIDTREQYWINYFNSHKKGFNATPGGDFGGRHGKACSWNGIEYKNQSEAARAIGVSQAGLQKWLKRGYACDDDVPKHWTHAGVTCTWNGVQYESYMAASRATGIGEAALRFRILKGQSCEADMPGNGGNHNTECCWNGVRYPSYAAASRATGIHRTALESRIKRGCHCDADMKRHHKKTSPRS
jgi:hypothetical protein